MKVFHTIHILVLHISTSCLCDRDSLIDTNCNSKMLDQSLEVETRNWREKITESLHYFNNNVCTKIPFHNRKIVYNNYYVIPWSTRVPRYDNVMMPTFEKEQYHMSLKGCGYSMC